MNFVMLWFIVTAGINVPSYIEPMSVYTPACGRPGLVVGVMVDRVVNPSEALWPDPVTPGEHCTVDISEKVASLPVGNFYIATTVVEDAGLFDGTRRAAIPHDPHESVALVHDTSLEQPTVNPCATPNANTILANTGVNKFFTELPDQIAVRPDGTPVVVAYQFGAWLEGLDPNAVAPSQGPSTLPKTGFVPVPGFAGCYELTGGLPGLIPQTARMAVSIRAQAQPGAPQPFSPWADLSNSFSLASTAVTPVKPGRSRISPP